MAYLERQNAIRRAELDVEIEPFYGTYDSWVRAKSTYSVRGTLTYHANGKASCSIHGSDAMTHYDSKGWRCRPCENEYERTRRAIKGRPIPTACSRCRVSSSTTEIQKNGYCRKCHAARMREYRAKSGR